jgi:hypothetical protein
VTIKVNNLVTLSFFPDETLSSRKGFIGDDDLICWISAYLYFILGDFDNRAFQRTGDEHKFRHVGYE